MIFNGSRNTMVRMVQGRPFTVPNGNCMSLRCQVNTALVSRRYKIDAVHHNDRLPAGHTKEYISVHLRV